MCRPKIKFADKFLGYYLNAACYHDQLLPYIVGTKVSSVSKASVAQTKLVVPEYVEQQAIAEILSNMDSEIEALEQKLAKYRQIKQGMMQQLLTGKIRLV
jgi:type I restriction enzyme S subunit